MKYIYIYLSQKKCKDFSGGYNYSSTSLPGCCTTFFCLPIYKPNEVSSVKASLSNSRSIEAFINPAI